MNVIEKYNQGQAGGNKGLYMGEGMQKIYLAINGVQKGRTYGVAAGPKVGKSTVVDAAWVIEPCLDALSKNIPIVVHYFSFEIDRVSKEFDFIAHFLYRDFGIASIQLPPGTTREGKQHIPLDSGYLMGQVQDDAGETILVSAELQEKIIKVYETRIIPFFGEYSKDGVQIKKGIINFIEAKENPTGLRNRLIEYAEQNGKFVYETSIGSGGRTFSRQIGYKPNSPDTLVLVVTDHLRKLPLERGFKMKENVDKYLEYCTELRNMCNYSFVHIIHLNRSLGDTNRLKFLDDRIYPTSEDIKDTGNLSEECNYLFTMFNPNDDKYNLKKHFGVIIKDVKSNPLYPDLRTFHLVESRHCFYPQHFALEMKGNIKHFTQFKTT